MKVRCPNCKTVLRVPEPQKPVEGIEDKSPTSYLDDLLSRVFNCDHPENVKVNGKCLACERERKR